MIATREYTANHAVLCATEVPAQPKEPTLYGIESNEASTHKINRITLETLEFDKQKKAPSQQANTQSRVPNKKLKFEQLA